MGHSREERSRFVDVRMRGFPRRTEVNEVWQLIRSRVVALPAERVSLADAAGRVLAADVVSSVAVPAFDRAAMDGYALVAEDTFGADPYNPLTLRIVGEAYPGRPCPRRVQRGEAARIMTGAPLPEGANAVLMAEVAEADGERVRVKEAVTPGRHVGHVGEDVRPGQIVLPIERRLRPQDVGLLTAIGVMTVEVIRRPRVALLVTGDELLPPGSEPRPFAIIDSNSPMLQALIRRDAAEPLAPTYLPDRADAIREALQSTQADVLLVSGGTSVGQEDHAPRLVAELGELPVHGVALRPASPTGVGFLQVRPVFLLPGNPVSCLCAYDLFAGSAVRLLGGGSFDLPYRTCEAVLAEKIVSAVGRFDYVRVRFDGDLVEPIAISGASILSSTVRADGFVLVEPDREGYPPGETVTVYLYD